MPRFMTLIRIEEDMAPEGPTPELMERMGVLLEEMTKAGVLLDTAGLAPTAEATRINWSGGSTSCTDGPFTESKEVIGGYFLLQAKDKAEAIEWTRRFVEMHPAEWSFTVEVREVAGG
ncbi:MAG TPA: YciI family protein [Streptomyces sp.]|nr:YciI family protein [Streptomyces sp.]